MKRLLLGFLAFFLVQWSCYAGCSQVIKELADKSLELSIITNQKTSLMGKIINEASSKNMSDLKSKKVSVDLPDLLMDLNQENGELSHVNAVLGAEIGKLIKSNPKCFK